MLEQSNVLAITGASAGLGEALALECAAPGKFLYLCARNPERLKSVAEACLARGAQVSTAYVDMRDHRAISDWIAVITSERPLETIFVNAGIFGGRSEPDAMEPPEVTRALIETNLTGAIIIANLAAQHMRAHAKGRIVLISSLAAKLPSPDAASYAASKAGLSAFGAALRDDLAESGVDVVMVHPGHIKTAQTQQQIGSVAHEVMPKDAAKHILKGIIAGRKEISFPLVARIWVRAMGLLPWRLRHMLTRSHRFLVRNAIKDPLGD